MKAKKEAAWLAQVGVRDLLRCDHLAWLPLLGASAALAFGFRAGLASWWRSSASRAVWVGRALAFAGMGGPGLDERSEDSPRNEVTRGSEATPG